MPDQPHHTPEPWQVYYFESDRLPWSVGRGTVEEIEGVGVDTQDWEEIATFWLEANARYACAAANACAGIPTEKLEEVNAGDRPTVHRLGLLKEFADDVVGEMLLRRTLSKYPPQEPA